MLDRRFIRENPGAIKEAVRVKGIGLDVDELLRLDQRTRELQREMDEANTQRKSLAKEFGKSSDERKAQLRAESSELDGRIRKLREELGASSDELQSLLLLVPMIPWEGSPVGPGEESNVVIKTAGQRPHFDFQPLDHVKLLEKRGWAEFARARKVSGERAYALTGDMVLLERAMLSYALDYLVTKGLQPISVPALVRDEALIGTGQFPAHREETYAITADDLYLAGTAEVALVGLHSGEILDHRQLPVRYAGISPCFRREAGSAGRDVRGLLRVHQFEKVEQFVICAADDAESDRWHAELLGAAEHLLAGLGLHYQIVECSTGDMGAGKYRMNDINTWFPSLETFRETHSCSSLHDWQAHRANLRYRDEEGNVRFAYTLNNTALATPRLLAALVENFQTADQKVVVPEVLRPYLGGRDLLLPVRSAQWPLGVVRCEAWNCKPPVSQSAPADRCRRSPGVTSRWPCCQWRQPTRWSRFQASGGRCWQRVIPCRPRSGAQPRRFWPGSRTVTRRSATCTAGWRPPAPNRPASSGFTYGTTPPSAARSRTRCTPAW